MTAVVVHYRGPRRQIATRVRQAIAALSGRVADPTGESERVLAAVGVAVLSDVRTAYVTKARGGTGEDGVRWPKLDPRTIAARRRGPASTHDKTQKDRNAIEKREYKKLVSRYSLSLPPEEAQARARQVASQRATRQTGKTVVNVWGRREVEILVDTRRMFNSITPGVATDARYAKLNDDQIFDVKPGHIVVGSNVAYFKAHDEGIGVPKRQILPKENQIPVVWWQRWLDVASAATTILIKRFLERT